MKIPAWQFYPGDWKKDLGVQALSFHERGVWLEILLLMFDSEDRGKLIINGKILTAEAIGRIIGLDKQNATKVITKLIDMGVAKVDENGAIYNKRMVRDEEIRRIRKECGGMGGNPSLLNQKSNQSLTTGVKVFPTPSSSSSSSSLSSSSSSEYKESTLTSAKENSGKRFAKPTPEEVKTYGEEIGFAIDGEKFCDHYAAKGWLVGKSPMKDWQAAVRTWRNGTHSTPVGKAQPRGRYELLEDDNAAQ